MDRHPTVGAVCFDNRLSSAPLSLIVCRRPVISRSTNFKKRKKNCTRPFCPFFLRDRMGVVRIRYNCHSASHSVDSTGWQAKMASIELWIQWRNAHGPHHKPLKKSPSKMKTWKLTFHPSTCGKLVLDSILVRWLPLPVNKSEEISCEKVGQKNNKWKKRILGLFVWWLHFAWNFKLRATKQCVLFATVKRILPKNKQSTILLKTEYLKKVLTFDMVTTRWPVVFERRASLLSGLTSSARDNWNTCTPIKGSKWPWVESDISNFACVLFWIGVKLLLFALIT